VPQKPDIKLPPDAIRATRAGSKPLAAIVRKHEEKKAKDEAAAKRVSPRKPGAAHGAGVAPPPAEGPATGRERPRRGGRVAAVAEEDREGAATPLGGREQRQLKRKRVVVARPHAAGEEDEAVSTVAAPSRQRRPQHIRRTGANTAAPRKGKVVVNLPCSVRSFSEALGVPARTILAKLLSMGTMSNIAANLDAETAELLAVELGVEVDFHRAVALEDKLLVSWDQEEDDPASLEPRPPIVTFLGHVDHGKTSLLDRIIGIDVAAHEKGGITQHIRAYRVQKDGRAITFVDTPGHEAFTEMRARGANVTDIAVLVVAADDGVMPQTEEAISHARAAGVPIVVALNKIDLPGVNIDHIYQQLATNELLPSEWGGETELVKTSATKGDGIDTLLETLLTVAELHEFRANRNRAAQGTCLESEMNEDRGVIAKFLVQKGTLHAGDIVVCGAGYGRVKAMYDTLDPHLRHEEAGPSTPVNVTGLSVAPGAGDRFYVLQDISQARELAERCAADSRQRELGGVREHVTLENLFERLGEQDQVQTLNIILRADVRGSIEAIRKELTKLEHAEVQIKILQATVGGITEADVHLADASDAVIIGFSVVADEAARTLAEQRGVQIRRYDIIYQVTEDLRAALEGMLRPEKREKDLGRALIQRTFHISRVGTVAGCRVLAGAITRDARLRVIRENRVIGDYGLDSLKREKDDAREVREGMECGIKLAGFNDLKEGDVLEAYKIEEIRRTFKQGSAS
jgi:translation initiation factor IF-2